MNPQNDANKTIPQASRQPSSLNVPPRAQPTRDINDSAFAINDIGPPPAPRAYRTAVQPDVTPQQTPPQAQVPTPVAPQQPIPTAEPIAPPVTAAPLPQAPANLPPAQQPAPIQNAQVASPQIPPMPVTPVEPPQPQVTSPPEPVVSQPSNQIPPQPASYSPATPQSSAPPLTEDPAYQSQQHIARDITERIDEAPQQNSKDIEALINRNHKLKKLKGVASFLVFIAGVIVAAFLINQYIFQSYYVEGTSMVPTLAPDDRLIIEKVSHTVASLQGNTYLPERGSIIVFNSSLIGPSGREEQLIKRVIGLPGDTIKLNDSGVMYLHNQDYPDGIEVAQLLDLNLQPTYADQPQEWTVADNHVFVVGDNRTQNGSQDSRAFGSIEANNIVGTLWLRMLPLNKAQTF